MKTLSLLLLCALLTACAASSEGDLPIATVQPTLPAGIVTDESGTPTLEVYVTEDETISAMDIESYVMGVVAGEMKNDWPLEALKAQAILARTFVVRFVSEKESRYEGADISTDIAEAQAYSEANINERIRQAVEETSGQVLVTAAGTLPYTWFHAHSGGMTELPSVALEYKGGDPEYLRPTASEESESAPESARRWTASFTLDQVARACADAGVKVGKVESVKLGEKGESGRIKALIVNGSEVSAPSFRIQIGANRLKSTLIDSVEIDEGRVVFRGRGFGHGVGLSQWGAYAMAEAGSDAAGIIARYFPGVELVELW